MAGRNVAENVFAFIDRAAVMRSRMLEERFSQEMYCNCLEGEMQSPIEQLFWIAANVLCESELHRLNPDPLISRLDDGSFDQVLQDGIYISSQHKVDQYRVDFLIEQVGIGPKEHLGPVVVELDGHAFHDKDKRQRSYEKARDRHLVRRGYRVLHFTGSDVVADPFKVAYEALELVGCFLGSARDGYDKNDPLGIGG